jgi:hypothetical protein
MLPYRKPLPWEDEPKAYDYKCGCCDAIISFTEYDFAFITYKGIKFKLCSKCVDEKLSFLHKKA